MALTPATWYNGSIVTPTFLQSIENFFNAGTFSAYSLYLDGSGGNAVTAPPAGTLRVSGTAFGTSTPTTTTTLGVLYKDLVPIAWGLYDGTTTTFRRGVNISSVSRSGAGAYSVIMATAAPSNNFTVSPSVSTGGSLASVTWQQTGNGSFTLATFNAAGSATDELVGFVVFG